MRTLPESPAAASTPAIPRPTTWAFPDIIESAREITPRNVEGRTFDRFGLAYPATALTKLAAAAMPAQQLQRYADIVTHAYPDAVFEPVRRTCQGMSPAQMNAGALANLAYISIHAVEPATRKSAEACLLELRSRVLDASPAR